MDLVPPERWQEVEALFGEVADLPTAERAPLLDARSIDPVVRADLDRLLAAHDRAGGFLDAIDAAQAAALLGPDPAEEGGRIGPYDVLRPLGRGGMGIVYLAHDPRLDRKVALKLLPPHVSGVEAARRRLVKEAQSASALDHPNIATIYEIGETESGQLFIAMAYYEGDTLQARIEQGPLPLGEVQAIAEQIAEGLAAAHRRGIVHRDIKPANVIVTPEGVAKIVDFGVARGTGADLTREGSTLGTVAYMSPEQTRGSAVDHRADLWSLGVVTYEMLTGVRPFEADSENLAVVRIRRDVPTPVEHLRPEAPSALARMIEGCLSKRPDARFASAGDVLVTLRTAASRERGVGSEREGLVVLPFVNISRDPANEYFSDGLTEEVITDLSHIQALRVISRTSAMRLKGSDKDVRTIAHELGVRYVLEGSVRKAGGALRITAQLIDAHRDVSLWARKIDGTLRDVFQIQEEVARAIVEALRIHLSPDEAEALADRPIPDARAFESYLRARFEAWRFSSEGLDRARRHIETALAIVGDNELLYSTLGHITAMYLEAGINPDPSALERVEELAEKVFALNPEAARGHWLKAFAALQRGDIREAVCSGERALVLAPDAPDTLILLGYVYVHVARNEEALALFERAAELDPLTPLSQAMPGFVAHLEGRFAEAVEPYRRYHEMDPDSPFGAVLYGWMLVWNRQFEEALPVLEAAAARFSGTPFGSWAQSAVHSLRGEFEEAVAAVTPALEAAARGTEMFARELANCYALAGAEEKALDWLEHAIALGMLNGPFLAKHNWFFAGLRNEPRFERLMGRVREARAQLPAARPWQTS